MSVAAAPEDGFYEVRNVRQVPGELRRRWFFSDPMDLIVWFDESGRPVSFQLAYDKHRDERVIRWRPGQGYSHHSVDDARMGSRAGSALLIPAGPFDAARVRARFLALSPALPWVVTQYVADRLKAYPQYRVERVLALAAVIVIPVLVVLALRSYRARVRDD